MENNQSVVKDESKKQNRVAYLDYLRVFATFFVVVNHTANQGLDTQGLSDFHWNIYNMYASISRWPIGIFVMISGLLFLGRDIDIKKLYSKYVLRLFIVFVVWKFVYALIAGGDFNNFINQFMAGAYHLWYLPMAIGLYMCTPMFSLIARNKKVSEYYMLLAFIFAFFLPTMGKFAGHYLTGGLQTFFKFIPMEATGMYMDAVLGYGFYYVLGYYIGNMKITKKQELLAYILGAFGFLSTIILDAIVRTNDFYTSFSVGVCLEVIGLYVFFMCHIKEGRFFTFVKKLSAISLGAYLVHVVLMGLLWMKLNIYVGMCHPLLSVPIVALCTFTCASIASYLLSKIPVLHKYIV